MIESTLSAPIQYVEVCLPLAIPRLLTYGIISEKPVEPGMRVVVPLKGNRLYTGIVWRLNPKVSSPEEIRMVLEIIDTRPYLDPIRMAFFEWMAGYYLCSLGEVLLAAIPAAHRPGSESYLQRNPDFDWREEDLDPTDRVLFEWLDKKGKLALAEVASRLNKTRGWMKRLRTLQDQGANLDF
jgi:primosomal protein N' (replication factor Y) (superfamily II helicase)